LTRKILLHVEFVYQFISLLFTFFSLANFYLTFYFIAGSLADPKLDPFGHNIGKYIFNILRYACVLLICLQFILSMGNRPQGAKRMFLSTMITYSIIMAYTTFAALFIVILQLKNHTLQSVDPGASAYQLGNNIFTNLIVSTVSTIGLYFLMSFLYLDPWHMFTSSAQYFALLPSYICTLQVYAFCNTHDVTWGTKGDNVIHTDLGAANVANGSANVVEVEMPSEQLDIDSGYDTALRNLRDRLEVVPPAISESQAQEDYYRAVRTYMVAVWMVCNAILAMGVSEAYALDKGIADNTYLKFLLWSVAAVAIFRALGSGAFAVMGVVGAVVEGRLQERVSRVFGAGDEKGERSSRGSAVGSGSEGGFSSALSSGISSGLSSIGSKLSSGFSWVSSRVGGRR
jgi:chitin synthase